MGLKYVITGGPGSGKSTLIGGLQERGYRCSEEISRRLIIEEVANGSDCLPWLDVSCFSIKVLREMIAAWEYESVHSLTFFDRSIPDIIAYLEIGDIAVDPMYYQALAKHPYHHQAFILPPWSDIYVNDSERWQTFDEAVAIHEAIRDTYSRCGFELIEVPGLPVNERVDFILSFLK